MLDGTGHDKTLDWWALGILIYELLSGIPPFYNTDKKIMFNNIRHGKILWPNKKEHGFSFSKEAMDLINQLLIRDKSKRLGAQGDSEQILSHRFFRGTNVKKVLDKKFKAPYKPAANDLSRIEIDA